MSNDDISTLIDLANAENEVTKDILMHYGMPRRSGRYPWGSGEDPHQHTGGFKSRVDELKKSGWKPTAKNIMDEFGMTTTQFRTEYSNSKDEERCYKVAQAKSMASDGLGASEIGRKMGVNESTVRSWLNAESEAKMNAARKTADAIKEIVDKKGMVDVGSGVERELQISKEKLNKALNLLKEDGYEVYSGGIAQATNPGKQTTQKVLCVPGTEHKEIYDLSRVHSLSDYTSFDGGDTLETFHYPSSMDSSRLKVRYRDEKGPDGATGIDKDGLIEIRRGCKDLSLGDARYAQVRILVDDTHYLKGMAVYSDDLPKGVDIVFNTNKTPDVPAFGPKDHSVLKPIKKDPENPFGSAIKPKGQSYYEDENGEKKLSLINKRADEGDWSEWKDALPSQFLSKQSKVLAQKQLDLAKANKMAEFDEYNNLTNPTIKKHLLSKFADECDAAAVNLQAAALPGQKYHVIIPINTLKDDEIYAPNYADGTKLALVRYPHGGTFEIPIVTVNNKHEPARKLLGTDVNDAVGINARVAERLSGADFDGDTVMCIPTHDKGGKVKIASRDPLDGLKDFDPKTAYPYREGMKIMKNTGTQMGIISNLITDMTLAGANDDELARAVRHSMVVIDAEKHKLDYKQSEVDNNIAALKKKYQAHVDADGNISYGGAGTLISRAKGQQSVLKREGSPYTNIKGEEGYDPSRPEGALIYKTAKDSKLYWEKTKVNARTGEETKVTMTKTQKSTRMAETDDAYSLVSEARNPMEIIYADYANSMKSLANKARLEVHDTGKIAYSKQAASEYKEEVASLKSKLDTALKNTPREREAQRRANVAVDKVKAADPDAKPGDIKKASQRELSKARQEVGSVSRRNREIEITDKEWKAIQSGAVSENTLKSILNNTNVDKLRQRATPKATPNVTSAQVSRIKAYANSNYTIAEIAAKMGVSPSTVSKYLKGGV